MAKIEYIIRTVRADVCSYTDFNRAKEEMLRHRARLGSTALTLIKRTITEEEIDV